MNIKEQSFKDLKAAWAIAVNNKDNHPHKDATYGNKIKGTIRAEHYMLYNLVRGLKIDLGFGIETQGYKDALIRLKHIINVNSLLYPFAGTLDSDEVEKLTAVLRPHR